MAKPSPRELIKIWEEHGVYCSVEDEDVENSPITGINFHGAKNADSVCHYIPLAPQVEDINFKRSDVTAKGLAYLKGHRNLQAVYLEDTDVAGAGYEVLTTLPKLRKLGCSPRHETGVALSWIGQLTKLTNLLIAESKIVDADLPAISHLGELTNLQLSKNDVDAGLSVVAQFPKLTWLVLSFTKISTNTLATVRLAKSVRKLFLEGVSLENAGLAEIAQMEKLTYLCFVGDQIDVVGITHLSALEWLEDLHIDDLVIVPEMVAEFAKLKQLKQLRLRSKADPKTVKALKKALPKCDVKLYDT